ncbi:MAG: hypothetical protein HXX11_21505 [Desulfuromonadales bacterium]|nr:hypothetical protein [Desulfuromonadales bacterium]
MGVFMVSLSGMGVGMFVLMMVGMNMIVIMGVRVGQLPMLVEMLMLMVVRMFVIV